MILIISNILVRIPQVLFPIVFFLSFIQKSKKTSMDEKQQGLSFQTVIWALLYVALVSAVVLVLGLVSLHILKTIVSHEAREYVDVMLGKNIYNILIYVFYIGIKLYKERKTKQKFILISLVSCVFAVGQIFFYYYLFLSNPSGLTEEIIAIATICGIVVLFVHGAMLELMERVVNNQQKQSEEEKKLLEKKYEYDYLLLAEEQAETVKKIHEVMRIQLKEVQNLMDDTDVMNQKQAKTILNKLETEVDQFGRVYYCDDAVLNTILSLKQEKARKLGIFMDIKVDSITQTGTDDIDLCSIVTNLLDNAIEATEKVEVETEITEANQKRITVRVGKRGGYLIFKTENPSLSVPKKNKKGRYISSKKESKGLQEHGRGLHIVEKTLEKYGGYLDFKEADGKISITAFVKAE